VPLRFFSALFLLGLGPRSPAPAIADITYTLKFTRATAATRTIDVTMRFNAASAGAVELSLPSWTPGAYEVSNFARKVIGFGATQGATELRWDKLDYDTWRVQVGAPGAVGVHFQFAADTLDNAMAWAKPDFVFLNGTNVFLYPEGSDLQFPATVTVETESDWRVVSAAHAVGAARFDAPNYHDLVDMPFFIGRFDVDSASIGGTRHRLATYPAGALAGAPRQLLWTQLSAMVPVMTKVFGETPWPDYTTFLVFDSAYGGGSALEHQSSHLGVYTPEFIGSPILASITAHEIFHAWNVKRLRPAEMVPYRYDRPQPTTLLWVSEGITDYYADLALVRGKVVDSTTFLNLTQGKIQEVAAVPAVALEDASLSTWIQPVDGTATIYYPKGSLAGMLIDILIRDATGDRASLDDVFRTLYQTVYKSGRGFTTEEWWATVTKVAGKDIFGDFARRYVDGREPFPWDRVAPLAGIRVIADTIREPRLGVGTATVDGRQVVTTVTPGGSAADAGIAAGDELVALGDLTVDQNFGPMFRARFRTRLGEQIPVRIRRGGKDLTLTLTVRADVRVEQRLEYDRRASFQAARIRNGILRGTVDRP
jgi:predicted metalloprotease with PDZ domain